MTKLDLALARLKQLPLDVQEALAVEIDEMVDEIERTGSLIEDRLTPEQWAELDRRLANKDAEYIPHEEVVAYFEKKYGR